MKLSFCEWPVFCGEGKKSISAFWIEHCHFPPTTSVHFPWLGTVFWVCHCVSCVWMCVPHILAVPSTQSHYSCVTPGSISRLPLCWFQIRHWLAGISQAWGLYSLSFCLVLSFPLSFWRARPSIDSKAASFLVFTSSDFCLRGLICPFCYTTRMPPRILKSNSCL